MSSVTMSPGTCVDDATVGTVSWSNPDNAKVSDNVYTVASVGTFTTTHYLKATNFGFSLPTGATINGLLIKIESKSNGGSFNNMQVIKADGSLSSTTKILTITATEAYRNAGSSTELWGESWTVSDINNSNFGASFYAVSTTNPEVHSIDHISITVYYTETSGATITGVQSITGIGSITL